MDGRTAKLAAPGPGDSLATPGRSLTAPQAGKQPVTRCSVSRQLAWHPPPSVRAGKRETTQNIGHVKINIKDVVRNRRLQDVWALQVRSGFRIENLKSNAKSDVSQQPCFRPQIGAHPGHLIRASRQMHATRRRDHGRVPLLPPQAALPGNRASMSSSGMPQRVATNTRSLTPQQAQTAAAAATLMILLAIQPRGVVQAARVLAGQN